MRRLLGIIIFLDAKGFFGKTGIVAHMSETHHAHTQVLLTIQETSRRIRLSSRQISNLKSQGDLPFVKIRGSVRFRVSDIDEFINSRLVNAKPGKTAAA